jgi:deoxycytidylate deaminase
MRPDWDSFFMVMAFWAARRSPDPSTKHGCIITDARHRILSEGFNGYPSGSDDERMPKDRPTKYWCVLHAEENAILFAKADLEGATAYVTGQPCPNCWARMIQKGIRRFVLGSKNSHMIDERAQAVTQLLLAGRDIEIVRWKPSVETLRGALVELWKELGITKATHQ